MIKDEKFEEIEGGIEEDFVLIEEEDTMEEWEVVGGDGGGA